MRRTVSFALLGLAVGVVGCGPPRSSVYGTVRYKGKALNAGTIILLAKDNQTHQGDIGPDGSYQVAGVARGAVRVSIVVEPPRPMPRPDPVKGADPVGGKEARSDDEGKLARQTVMRPTRV